MQPLNGFRSTSGTHIPELSVEFEHCKFMQMLNSTTLYEVSSSAL